MLELICEFFAFIAAFVALVLLAKARHGNPVKPAIIALGVSLGFDLLEVLVRWRVDIKGTVESATVETFSALLIIMAMIYAFRFGEEKEKRLLGYAILCTVLVTTLFCLELLFSLVIRE
jgi:heme/copper-type cytochrome/quinol oxidase subunit 4